MKGERAFGIKEKKKKAKSRLDRWLLCYTFFIDTLIKDLIKLNDPYNRIVQHVKEKKIKCQHSKDLIFWYIMLKYPLYLQTSLTHLHSYGTVELLLFFL